MSFPTAAGQAVEGVPYREAQSCLGPTFAGATYQFSQTVTGTPTNVYQDGALTSPFPILGQVTADNYGRFPPIYLDTAQTYRVQLYDNTNTLRWTVDPYVPPLSTVGTSSTVAFGFSIAPTGELTIPAPNSGGAGVALTLNPGAGGGAALRLIGTLAGNSALIINNSATTGVRTATFNANNKPGPPPTTYAVTATVAPSGATYTGGNLTAAFTGVTGGNYTVQLSTGQDIFGVTFTNGSTTFITPSTNITPTPTTALTVTTPVTPSWWLPITCDGVQYYTPIWHGSSQSQFLPSAPASPSPQGETIVAQSVVFGGSGLTTATGGTATPGNWLSPTSVGAGTGYWIKITKTGGLSGLAFSAAQGSWTNIGAGLTISSNAQAQITGTYQLSTSVTGSPVVASGSITLSGNNGIQQPTYNGAANLVLAGNGTATLNGVSSSNWFAPTTSNVGASYWINITRTGGSTGTSFSAAQGAWTNITNGGLTIGITGGSGTSFNVVGTYQIASDSGGVNVLGGGSVTLTGGSTIASTTWSGTTPLVLAGNGSATLNGSATTSWLTPNTANVGSGYWINISRTGGTSGVNFSAAQGAWTNITNSGLSIGLTGYTGDVGTVSASGTYQISSSNTGSPVLGSGSVSLSVNAGTVTRTYTSGTAATETIPIGATTAVIEVFGAGGGGGCTAGVSQGASGGGSGGYSRTSEAVVGGRTLTYTIGAGGAGRPANTPGVGSTGGASSVSSGTQTVTTMTSNGGAGGGASVGGAGGTASGGTAANTTGNTGSNAVNPSPGGAGGTGVVGVNGTGNAGGAGGTTSGSAGGAGGSGKIVFSYS